MRGGWFLNQPPTPQVTQRAAKMMHAALFAGVVVIFAFLSAMRLVADPSVTTGLAHILRYAGLAQLIVIGIVIFRIRNRIPAFGSGDDIDGWWAMSGRAVVLTWVLSEATATLAGVIWFLTADPAMLVVIVAALVLLYRLRPGVWTAPES